MTRQANRYHHYVLIHSPLVGGLTWTLVADELRLRGHKDVIPILKDSSDSKEAYWKQHAESVSQALMQIPKDEPVTLIGHSGAGPLLPAIRQSIPNPVSAYVFVDAGIPSDGATRLDLMSSEDPDWAKRFEEELKRGVQFPVWSSEDLREIIPDENLRNQLVAEIHPRGLAFFTEPIPVFREWPDAPCIYIQFSAPYEKPAAQARRFGWQTYELRAGHFHMLVDASAVTDIIVEAVNDVIG
ncbi:MAG TPA: alpha/beta fold hydrolase [Anaerolineales bacterium]|nr:alpha/beta fold hydrolase [Anaerolineales bacterium]